VDRRGRIVLGGYVPTDDAVFVGRVLSEGTLDPSFGDGGKVYLNDVGMDTAWALDVGPDDAIYLGGQMKSGSAAVIKIMPNGTLDPAWGNGGVALGPNAKEDQLYGLAVEPSGKIVGAGFRGLADEALFFVARWDTRGRLDPDFGSRGWVTTKISKGGNFGIAAARDKQGRLVVAGGSADAFAFARYWL